MTKKSQIFFILAILLMIPCWYFDGTNLCTFFGATATICGLLSILTFYKD